MVKTRFSGITFLITQITNLKTKNFPPYPSIQVFEIIIVVKMISLSQKVKRFVQKRRWNMFRKQQVKPAAAYNTVDFFSSNEMDICLWNNIVNERPEKVFIGGVSFFYLTSHKNHRHHLKVEGNNKNVAVDVKIMNQNMVQFSMIWLGDVKCFQEYCRSNVVQPHKLTHEDYLPEPPPLSLKTFDHILNVESINVPKDIVVVDSIAASEVDPPNDLLKSIQNFNKSALKEVPLRSDLEKDNSVNNGSSDLLKSIQSFNKSNLKVAATQAVTNVKRIHLLQSIMNFDKGKLSQPVQVVVDADNNNNVKKMDLLQSILNFDKAQLSQHVPIVVVVDEDYQSLATMIKQRRVYLDRDDDEDDEDEEEEDE